MKQQEPLSVFIADDSDSFRTSLKAVLGDIPGVNIVGEVSHAGQLMDKLFRLKPDLVILDIRMSGGNSFNVLKQIKKMIPSTIVSIITEYAFDLYYTKCLELGADYFFDKSMEIERLIKTIGQMSHAHAQVTAV